jgi:hypothetical protein
MYAASITTGEVPPWPRSVSSRQRASASEPATTHRVPVSPSHLPTRYEGRPIGRDSRL